MLQLPLMKSNRNSAVVLGSTVTGFNCGGGGSCRLCHSAVTSAARAGATETSAAAIAAAAAAPRVERANDIMRILPKKRWRARARPLPASSLISQPSALAFAQLSRSPIVRTKTGAPSGEPASRQK